MINVTTEKPLRVSTDGTAGPYLKDVPVSQLDELTRLFTTHQINYEVDELSFSHNGEPFVTTINFGRRGDAAAVQRIIDGIR